MEAPTSCPECGAENMIHIDVRRDPQLYQCHACKLFFAVRVELTAKVTPLRLVEG